MYNLSKLPGDRKYYAMIINSKSLTKEERALAFNLLDNVSDDAKIKEILTSHYKIMTEKHHPFPSIEQFSHVRRNVQYKAQFKGFDDAGEPIMDRTAKMPILSFEGTVKLHGTNNAIILTETSFYCQSRERIITPESDNAGAARFVYSLSEDDVNILRSNIDWVKHNKITIFSEWAGKGIQKTVAISQIDKSVFIFKAAVINEDEEKEEWISTRGWKLPNGFYDIYSFPNAVFRIDIDFGEPEYAIEKINKWVLEVEEECPVGKAFGISGIGEGIVFSCVTPGWESSRYWMKCKGSKHANSKVRTMVTVDIEKFESEKAFVESVLDEGRLEQGFNWLKSNGHPIPDQTSTGEFIRFIFNDVLKEAKLEMEASGIEEKNLGKLLAQPVKKWYFDRLNRE